ncbi:FAD-binding protein [Vibrio makurazakiensis]|uniref:electron transfer flavoprotein subunit alpha/FixB family protein n=1 Tax=Vibrio makurazakiensis TaxID=2910250 RepID=UPI003D0AC637
MGEVIHSTEELSKSVLSTLVIVEHDNRSVSSDTLCTLQAASHITGNEQSVAITALIIGYQCQSVVDSITQFVDHVLVIDSERYQYVLAETYSDVVAKIGTGYSHLLAPATTFGKNLMPRVAAMLNVGQLSDVTEIETSDIVIRPVYAGNALARVKSNDPIKVITVRSSAFNIVSAKQNVTDDIKVIDPVSLDADSSPHLSEFKSQHKVMSERPELPAARVVISGGRGLGSKENFALVEQLADKLGGAIGASRAAVDAGFVSNDLQVGQTGKIVAPELYIAIGISGAIQHLAGMKDSKIIVAINSDPEAPIFQIADYGLVGDLFEIMPELIGTIDS